MPDSELHAPFAGPNLNGRQSPPQTIIFDLSEVLIAGLLGIEKPLAARLGLDEGPVLKAFGGELLRSLCCGHLTEEAYLAQVITSQKWDVPAGEIKALLRQNFQRKVPGMEEILAYLAGRYELVLLSDHAAEWVKDILAMHPFLGLFSSRFFSFQLKQTKQEAATFREVLAQIDRRPEECLFIDDSAVNIQAAISAGVPSIRFTSAPELQQYLQNNGWW